MTGQTRFSLYLLLIMLLAVTLTGCGDTKPDTPTGLNAVGGDGKVTISWNSRSSTTYRLYWSTTSGGANIQTGTKIDPATSPYVLTGLTNGTPCYFAVMAVNTDGESPLSSEVSATPGVSAPPAAPTGVVATPGVAKANISWTAAAGATSYYVYYATTAANATRVNGFRFSPANTTSQEITGLTAGTWYFVVTAVNANGDESVASAPVASATL